MQAERIVLADMLEHMQIVAAIAEVVLAVHLEPIDRGRATQELGVMGSAQTDADAAHSDDGCAPARRVGELVHTGGANPRGAVECGRR